MVRGGNMIVAGVVVLCCLLVGWLGRKRAIGFFGFLALALALSPLLAFVILRIGANRKEAH